MLNIKLVLVNMNNPLGLYFLTEFPSNVWQVEATYSSPSFIHIKLPPIQLQRDKFYIIRFFLA